MIAPPRTTELLLASLGAQPDFRDAVIGDLAEEFVQRAEQDGLGAARRWYHREAVRAMPHLANNALRHRGLKGLRRSVGIASAAYTITFMAGIATMAIVVSIAAALGAPMRTWYPPTGHSIASIVIFVGILTLNAAVAIFGGYLAAYLDSDAPLLSACTLGAVWLAVLLAASAIIGAIGRSPATAPTVPQWYRFVGIAVIILGPIAGGVRRVRSRQPLHDEDLLRAGA